MPDPSANSAGVPLAVMVRRCRLFHAWSQWQDVPNDDDWLPYDMEWRVPMQRRRCVRCNQVDHRRTLV